MSIRHTIALNFDDTFRLAAVCTCGWESERTSPGQWRAEAFAEAAAVEHETYVGLVGVRSWEGFAEWTVHGTHAPDGYHRVALLIDGAFYGFDALDGAGNRAIMLGVDDVPREHVRRFSPPVVVEIRELSRPFPRDPEQTTDDRLSRQGTRISWRNNRFVVTDPGLGILYATDERTGLVVLEVGNHYFHAKPSGFQPAYLSEDVPMGEP